MMLSGLVNPAQRVSLVTLVLGIWGISAQAQCFLPNGSPATGDIPCNSTPETTDCCPSDYQCLPFTRLCYKANPANASQLLFARGSCTDQSWGPGCPGFCSTGELNSSTLVRMDRCEANPEEYCCVEGSAAGCTCGADNTVNVFETAASTSTSSASTPTSPPQSSRATTTSASQSQTGTPATSLAESAPASATSSSPSAATTEAASGNHLTLAQKIGIGVGVSIGTIVVSLGGLVLMMYRMRSDPDDPEEDDALNEPVELPDPPSTTNSYQGGSMNSKKATSPSHWLGTAVEEASRRPFSEASSQYTTEIPYGSSTTFAPTHQSSDRSASQWPLSSEWDSPQVPQRALSPAYRSSYDIFGNTHRNEI